MKIKTLMEPHLLCATDIRYDDMTEEEARRYEESRARLDREIRENQIRKSIGAEKAARYMLH